jgi:DNA mismatch endonuclease (patch repair protein)
LHDKNLPGCPDIVLKKYKTVIFVHGCFWHRHQGCRYAYSPKSRVDFWQRKFKDNVDRDKANIDKLISVGWEVVIVWECESKDEIALSQRLSGVLK